MIKINTKDPRYLADLERLRSIRKKIQDQVVNMINMKAYDKRKLVTLDPRLREALKMGYELQGLLHQVGDMIHGD